MYVLFIVKEFSRYKLDTFEDWHGTGPMDPSLSNSQATMEINYEKYLKHFY